MPQQSSCHAFTTFNHCTDGDDELQTIVTDHVPSSLSDGPGPGNCGTQVLQPWPNNLADLELVSLWLLALPNYKVQTWCACLRATSRASILHQRPSVLPVCGCRVAACFKLVL